MLREFLVRSSFGCWFAAVCGSSKNSKHKILGSKERELLGQRAGITFDVCRKPTTSIFFFSKNFKIAPKTQVIPART